MQLTITVPRPQEGCLEETLQTLFRLQGLDVAAFDESFLSKSLARRWQITGCASSEAYLQRLAIDGAEAKEFVQSLHVAYSEFFRNPLAFAVLEQIVLPRLVETKTNRGDLRVWSAGCAAGQEAWSVAILLDELIRARNVPLSYRIFATDSAEAELVLARDGIYSTAAVGNVRQRQIDACFVRQDGAYAIADRLRERVEFAPYDLLDDKTTCPPASIYGDFDLVLCCNVMLYYRPDVQRRIVGKLCRGTAAGGYLMTGEAERHVVESAGGFHAVAPPATLFRKTP